MSEKSPPKRLSSEDILLIIGFMGTPISGYSLFQQRPGAVIGFISVSYLIFLLIVLKYVKINAEKKNLSKIIKTSVYILLIPGIITILDLILSMNLLIETKFTGGILKEINYESLGQTFFSCFILIGLNAFQIMVFHKTKFPFGESLRLVVLFLMALTFFWLFDKLMHLGIMHSEVSVKYLYIIIALIPMIFFFVYSFYIIKDYYDMLR